MCKMAFRVSLGVIWLIVGLLPAGIGQLHAQEEPRVTAAGAYVGMIEVGWFNNHYSDMLLWVDIPEITETGSTTIRMFLAEFAPNLRLIIPSENTVDACLPAAGALTTHRPVDVAVQVVENHGTFEIYPTYPMDNCPSCLTEACQPDWQINFTGLIFPLSAEGQLYTNFGTMFDTNASGINPPVFLGIGALTRLPDDAPEPAIECDHTGDCTFIDPRVSAGRAYAGTLTLDNGHEAWLWLDVPDTAAGTVPMRLFAIQREPQLDLIAPEGIEADACPPETGIIDYPPAVVEGVFAADGSFTTEYVWWVCPSCLECFVNFSETLQISAVPDGDGWLVEAAVIRYMQEESIDDEIMYQGSGHLSPVEPGLPAPVYRCDADGLCRFDFPLAE